MVHGRTDGQGDSYIPPPPQTLFAGGIKIVIVSLHNRRNKSE
jgi:hypothetical protein